MVFQVNSVTFYIKNNFIIFLVISSTLQGRGRRRANTMMLVLMGIVVFLMFFVTIGFQFLATFGGKSFLMAKLALLLASINGLKKIATQGVHYGLYHAPDPSAYYGYERYDPRKY